MTPEDKQALRVIFATLYHLIALVVLAWAAIDAFGWLHGAGVVAAVWLVFPWQPARRGSP